MAWHLIIEIDEHLVNSKQDHQNIVTLRVLNLDLHSNNPEITLEVLSQSLA